MVDIVRRTVKKKKERKDLEKFNGKGWWQGFMQRHPKLSSRTSDPLSYCRSNAVDKDSLDYSFSVLKQALEDNNLMNTACYIYNTECLWTTNSQSALLHVVSPNDQMLEKHQ